MAARRQSTETRDGQTFTVTRLPQDPRLQPAATRKRTLWNKLTAPQKAAYIARRKRFARKRGRRKPR
jgi:hypothetical protein